MTLADGCDDLVGCGLDFKVPGNHFDHVADRSERIGLRSPQPFFQGEAHGGSHKCHVMVPALPFADLVVGHAQFTLAVFKRPFHEIALALVDGQLLPAQLLQAMAETVLELPIGCLTDQQPQFKRDLRTGGGPMGQICNIDTLQCVGRLRPWLGRCG